MFDWKEYKRVLRGARKRHQKAEDLKRLRHEVTEALQSVSTQIKMENFTDAELEELLNALFRKHVNVTVLRSVLREKDVLYNLGEKRVPLGITVEGATIIVVIQSMGKPVLTRAKARRLED